MVADTDIIRAARLLIRQHGDAAGIYAANLGQKLALAGNAAAAAVWHRIKKAIGELEVERAAEEGPP